MPHILRLAGSAALSSFRLDKLTASLARTPLARTRIATRYWHFVMLSRLLLDDEAERLNRVLAYGSPAAAVDGAMLLVVPRLGTISLGRAAISLGIADWTR